jgi:hypothetical protein
MFSVVRTPKARLRDQLPHERVVNVPELLSFVISFLDKHDILQCALVCKSWSTVALDVLWRTMNSATDLLGLLGPMSCDATPTGPGETVRHTSYSEILYTKRGLQWFDHDPEPSAWALFEPYARRVRTFIYTDGSEDMQAEGGLEVNETMTEDAWDAVSRTRTTLHILPNLLHLTWLKGVKDNDDDHQLKACAMLLHANIKSLAVAIPVTGMDEFGSLMLNIAGRAPNLEVLDLRANFALRWDGDLVEHQFMECVRHLRKLRKIIVPAFWLTTRVIEVLAELPVLRVVQYELFYPDRRGKPEDVLKFKPELKEGAFPSLLDLSLAADVLDIISFLAADCHPSSVSELFLHNPNRLPSIPSITELLIGMPTWLPRLKKLYLEFRVDRADVPEDVFIPASLGDLVRSIRKMPKLEVFEFYWQYALPFTSNDLEKLATSLPSIRRLILNPEPFAGGTFMASLLDLRIFARHCPNIEQLGLYFSVDASSLDRERETGETASAVFAGFLHLHVGASTIDPQDAASVAMWLSKVCPHGCAIVSGYSWMPSAIAPEWDAEQGKTWARVNEMLSLVSIQLLSHVSCFMWRKCLISILPCSSLRSEKKNESAAASSRKRWKTCGLETKS